MGTFFFQFDDFVDLFDDINALDVYPNRNVPSQ